jgi:hypothetical protein
VIALQPCKMRWQSFAICRQLFPRPRSKTLQLGQQQRSSGSLEALWWGRQSRAGPKAVMSRLLMAEIGNPAFKLAWLAFTRARCLGCCVSRVRGFLCESKCLCNIRADMYCAIDGALPVEAAQRGCSSARI